MLGVTRRQKDKSLSDFPNKAPPNYPIPLLWFQEKFMGQSGSTFKLVPLISEKILRTESYLFDGAKMVLRENHHGKCKKEKLIIGK